jgi:hypothetical protein
VFSWFPGYPAAVDALAWLPWITTVTMVRPLPDGDREVGALAAGN